MIDAAGNSLRYQSHIAAFLYKLPVLCYRLLFGVNEKLLTQHILGPVTKYML